MLINNSSLEASDRAIIHTDPYNTSDVTIESSHGKNIQISAANNVSISHSQLTNLSSMSHRFFSFDNNLYGSTRISTAGTIDMYQTNFIGNDPGLDTAIIESSTNRMQDYYHYIENVRFSDLSSVSFNIKAFGFVPFEYDPNKPFNPSNPGDYPAYDEDPNYEFFAFIDPYLDNVFRGISISDTSNFSVNYLGDYSRLRFEGLDIQNLNGG